MTEGMTADSDQTAKDTVEQITAQDSDGDIKEQVVELAEHYLGFAAEEYLDRQCRIHLDKPLNTITEDDLDALSRWVNNTAPLVMDKEDGTKLAEQIAELHDDEEL